MTEENKEYIKTELEKLHELSMKMEEIISDLDSKIVTNYDIGYLKSGIEGVTSDIQDQIDSLPESNDEDIVQVVEYQEEEIDPDLLVWENSQDFALYQDTFDDYNNVQ